MSAPANPKAVQQALNAAGASPALTVDGAWGPKSQAALVAFQRTHRAADGSPLVADGVAGPKTLAALGLSSGTTSSTPPRPTGNPADVAAYAVAKRAAPNMPEAQRQYVLTVARGEGGYGNGWSNPSAKTIELSKRFGLTGFEGKGSNNWGAEQGSGDAGSFKHVDTHADGTPYVGTYKRWSTPEQGFLSVAKTILNGGKRGDAGSKEIQAAIARGDLKAAVFAQHANGYFELDPAKYLEAVERNYAALTSATGWSALLVGAAVGGGLLLGLAVTTALGTAAWWWFRHRGGGA